ncbi:M28 family peptidase [Consotaella aegiceratis]|uniref:M28 family peptidase n=1 Tax=Consotaella aegiceratis TaxID=3097961 RepID=UPI002F403800
MNKTDASIDLDNLVQQVSRQKLMEHIDEFARRIKLSGTPEELESFRYLERRMREYGFQTTLLSHDAYISLPGASRLTVAGQEIASITQSMAASTPAGGLEAELVYAGEGDEAAFRAIDARGKIALIDGIAVEDVSVAARAAGAVGEIHISPTEHLYEMCISAVWGSPSQHTREGLPVTAVCTVSRDDGERLRARLQAGETLNAVMHTTVDTGWCKTPLLVADLMPGHLAGDDEAPFVMFSGHHDTWHYGVMDNGGANASMLEAARLLAAQAAHWRRGLRVCFWSGHSHGRYSGSAWYADEFWDELDRRCAVHVNLDSTGGKGASVLTRSGVVDELKAVAADAVAAISGQQHAGRRQSRAGDQSFWGVGIPSMFGSLSHQPPGKEKMLVPLGWWWHTPLDLAENIDPENLDRDTRVILHVLGRLLTAPVLPLAYGDYADALRQELAGLAEAIGSRLDLSKLVAQAEDLKRAAEVLAASPVSDPDAARRADAALMRASRSLVPINYTEGDRFVHDSALPNRPWPSLEGLRELARLDADAEETPFYVAHARRTRNRVGHALREALAALREGTAG